jgi:hypothetical protein
MRVLWSFLAAAIAACIIWTFGGPLGAWLNAPGFVMLHGAMRMGFPGATHDSTLREWLWLGTVFSVLFWWVLVYVALALVERKGKWFGRSKGTRGT